MKLPFKIAANTGTDVENITALFAWSNDALKA